MNLKKPNPWPQTHLLNAFLGPILNNWQPSLNKIKGKTLTKKTCSNSSIITS